MSDQLHNILCDDGFLDALKCLPLSPLVASGKVLGTSTLCVDGTTKLVCGDENGTQCWFVLLTPAKENDLVKRNVERAHLISTALGFGLSSTVLLPITSDRYNGIRYAVYPYCRPLSTHWFARKLVRPYPTIVKWLQKAITKTVSATSRRDSFREALLHVVDSQDLSSSTRRSAEVSLDRLETECWQPRHAMMHNDLWAGNILHAPTGQHGTIHAKNRQMPFVLIDWAGSMVQGYPCYDLLRLLATFRIRMREARKAIADHCQALKCEQRDFRSYVAAAVGHLGANLENFPRDSYVALVEQMFRLTEEAGA